MNIEILAAFCAIEKIICSLTAQQYTGKWNLQYMVDGIVVHQEDDFTPLLTVFRHQLTTPSNLTIASTYLMVPLVYRQWKIEGGEAVMHPLNRVYSSLAFDLHDGQIFYVDDTFDGTVGLWLMASPLVYDIEYAKNNGDIVGIGIKVNQHFTLGITIESTANEGRFNEIGISSDQQPVQIFDDIF